LAGVGKHELKLAYELAFIEEDNAPANTFCSAAARGPGVHATGAWGGGEGEAEFLAGIVSLQSSLVSSLFSDSMTHGVRGQLNVKKIRMR